MRLKGDMLRGQGRKRMRELEVGGGYDLISRYTSMTS